jgi:glyoxylase-like metal-dependent hydrolase (beta-lactamase superfamily II)
VDELGKPLLGVIITHAHPDHYGGLVALVRDLDVPVFATSGVAQVIRRDDPVKEQILSVLALDGIRLRVTDLGPNESPHDRIWAPEDPDRQVFSADLA